MDESDGSDSTNGPVPSNLQDYFVRMKAARKNLVVNKTYENAVILQRLTKQYQAELRKVNRSVPV